MRIDSDQFLQICLQKQLRFNKCCVLEIITDSNGVIEYKPQLKYNNKKNYPYLDAVDETTIFCKFKATLPQTSGVYLWVVSDEIVYIGEAINLYKRFNVGYGNISPRNCFLYGQSTNVKMNRVALSYFKQNIPIEIYIFQTHNHKEIEAFLLKHIKTQYNSKNNN